MNKSSKLFLVIVTVFLLAASVGVECRRTYSSRSSSSGRGNRGKNQPSGGGMFSSWFGGSKTSSSGSGSLSKPASSSSAKAQKNWQTATSHSSSQPKPGWANPSYKPAPSAPRETSYGWKSNPGSNTKPGSALPSSNIGSRGYPVQSGVQHASQPSYGGFKPASAPVNTHNTHSQPSSHQTAYHSSHNYQPSHGTAPQPAYHPSHNYQPSHGAAPQPSYHPSAGHHSSGYPQQPAHYPSHSYSGYPSHSSFGSSVPSYQGTKMYGGGSGHYGYPGGNSWGVNSYGSKKSSGTGKLLTGLAVGAAGGYLTSSLVNRISNPWRYSGYGYGLGSGGLGYGGLGYGGLGSGLGYGSGINVGLTHRDESAFERGYERGARDRMNENNKPTPAPASPEPEDPTSKWIQCVAFDPQTQQTLINPNCSCTVTTSLDERTGQPISVHQCTTLNGLVLKPIPFNAGGIASGAEPPNFNTKTYGTSSGGVDGQASSATFPQSPAGAASPPLDSPEPFPTYGAIYQGDFEYKGGSTVYLPPLTKTNPEPKPEANAPEAATTERKAEDSTPIEGAKGTVEITEVTTAQKAAGVESVGSGGGEKEPENVEAKSEALSGAGGSHDTKSEFYGQLQKIVNMGNFVDGG